MKSNQRAMETSDKSTDSRRHEHLPHKQSTRRVQFANATKSKSSAPRKAKNVPREEKCEDISTKSQESFSVPSSQIQTKYVTLIDNEDSMKDFQSPDVVFVGVSSRSKRQTTISDLFGTGGDTLQPKSLIGKGKGVSRKSPSKGKVFKSPKKSPRKKRTSKKAVGINRGNLTTLLRDTEKTVSSTSPESTSCRDLGPERDEDNVQSCPLCQMPFSLLHGSNETAETHTAACMDMPFDNQRECELGAACQNKSPSHYRSFQHGARAALLSRVNSTEWTGRDPADFVDSGISSAECTPLDCLGESASASCSADCVEKTSDSTQSLQEKCKGNKYSLFPLHPQQPFSPIPEVANASFLSETDPCIDGVTVAVNLGEERHTEVPKETGRMHKDSKGVTSFLTARKSASLAEVEDKEKLNSIPPSAISGNLHEDDVQMNVSPCSDGDSASEDDNLQDSLKAFTSSSEEESEVVGADEEMDDEGDDLITVSKTRPSDGKSSPLSEMVPVLPNSSPCQGINSTMATQQLSIFNFFQPLNQKSAKRTDRHSASSGTTKTGEGGHLPWKKRRTDQGATGKAAAAGTDSVQGSAGALRKSVSDVGPGSTSREPGGGHTLLKSLSEILQGGSRLGGGTGRRGRGGAGWQTAAGGIQGSGRGRGSRRGRGGGDLWNEDGGGRACPFYKKIPDTGITVDAFRYGTIPGCRAYFLTHFHYDHFGGLTKNFAHPLYCSKVTGNLVRKRIGVRECYVHCLPLDTPCVVDGVEVILIEANHCPGAVLLLFRLPNGRTVLHTGDFRADPSMETHPALVGTHIHSLYLDTTYCDPSYTFPPQQEVVRLAVSLVAKAVEENPQVLVVCGAYTIGKEKIFAAVAEMLDCKIGVLADKKAVLQCLENPGLVSRITTRLEDAQVHVLPMGQVRGLQLEAHLGRFRQFSGLLAFEPTGWTFSKKALSLDQIRPKYNRNGVVVYGVPYSEHSSFLELKRFVQFTRPDKILPTVNNGSAASRRKMEGFFRQWLSDDATSEKHSPAKQTSLTAWRK